MLGLSRAARCVASVDALVELLVLCGGVRLNLIEPSVAKLAA
jgi:hypothetical protein